MAKPELLQSISSLAKKIDALSNQNLSLMQRIKELEDSNRLLSIQHLNDVKELEKAQKEIEFLSLSHRLAASPEALVEARNKVSSLIRTIDSCIRLIKED
ncbi:MAG: hypothetical protein J1F16_06325 [Muribaculaceae bacterium]|nr:hypothetical protein [Muribaculaceae bacterium]